MDIREFSRAYARSPLGLGSIVAALGAGTAAGLLGAPPALAALAALGAFALLLALALGLGVGQRAAVDEADRRSRGEAALRIAEAAAARARLASIRFPAGAGEPPAGELAASSLAKARDLLVLEAGSFIEGCSRAGTWDPEGVAAIVDGLAIVDAWLKEMDESSVEKRFELPDAKPFPEAAARTARLLQEKALLVAARRASALGEMPAADRIAIEEELK